MAKRRPSNDRRKTVRKSASQRRSRRPARKPMRESDLGYDEDILGYEDEMLGYDDDWRRYDDDFSGYEDEVSRYDDMPRVSDEDMLSEFSDETNDFYTDEHRERRRRGERNSGRKNASGKSNRKSSKKSDQKAEKKTEKKVEKRKPISPLKRKIIRIISYTAIITVVLIVGVVLSLTVLFKTQVYEVEGNTLYDEDAIIETCGIGKGENIFLAPKKPAEKRIKEKFPYVEEATVSFQIPDTIKISIEEAVEGYLVKKNNTEYFLISTKGRILDEVTDISAHDLPVFVGPNLVSGQIGDYAEYEDDTVVEMTQSITQTFTENGYSGITEIDASNMASITFTYDDRIVVKLGIPEDLDYKIRTAMTIINEHLDKNQTGTTRGILDVSRCNSTKRSYFDEQEIHPTESKPGATTPTTAPDSEEDWSEEQVTYDEEVTYDEGDYIYSEEGYYENYSGSNGDGNYE